MPKELKLDESKDFKGWVSREAVLAPGKKAQEDGSYRAVITTEQPAIVVDWERWEVVREILLMSGVRMPATRQVPLLDTHCRFALHYIKGSIRNIEVVGKNLEGDVHFTSLAKDEKTLVDEGHLTDLSAGYRTFEEHTIEIKPGKEEVVNGVLYKNDYGDNYKLLIRVIWELKEGSLVPIGADSAAKFKSELQPPVGIKTSEEPASLITVIENLRNEIENLKKGGKMPEETKGAQEKTPEQLRSETISAILDIAEKQFNGAYKDMAMRFVREINAGKSATVAEFQNEILNDIQKSGGKAAQPASFMGMNAKEIKEFSITRAVQGILNGETKGIEFDISSDIAKRMNESAGEKSLWMPADITNIGLRSMVSAKNNNLDIRALANMLYRAGTAHTMANNDEGGYFVTPDYRADLLKDVIVNETIMGRAGCTVITGLQGQFQMPKIVSGLSSYAAAENTASNGSYVITGLETVDQKRITGWTEYGRQLLMNMNNGLAGFDQILIRLLYLSADVKQDYDFINGDGLSNNIKGLLSYTGPAAASLASVNWKAIVNFSRLIKKANGFKEGMKWLGSVDVESILKITEKATSTNYGFLLQDGKVDGYDFLSGNQIPDNVSAFGYWPEFFLLFWGAERLVIADQVKHKQDMVEISLHRYANTFMRSSESFAIASDTTLGDWE